MSREADAMKPKNECDVVEKELKNTYSNKNSYSYFSRDNSTQREMKQTIDRAEPKCWMEQDKTK